MEQTTLTTQADFLTIEHLGARKLLTLNSTPILIKVNRGDGKVGSTHPCTPIFAADHNHIFDLNQHGNTRNEECQVEKVNGNEILITHQITDEHYPAGMLIEQQARLKNSVFELQVTHTNTGNQPAPVNTGEHCYFDAPQGYQGTKINDQDVTDWVTEYKNGYPFPLQASNLINIPGKPAIELKQNGFKFAKLWVGMNSKTGKKDTNYICIEPVEDNPDSDFFGSEASMIQPGESRRAELSIKIKKTPANL